MNIKRIMRLVPGVMILISLTLSHFVNPLWLLLAAFVGVNLLQSSITNWCLLESLLQKTHLPSGCGDVEAGAT